MNIEISSNFNSRKFERELSRELGKAAEKGIRSKLSPAARRGLKIKFDGKSRIELIGPEILLEEAKKKLS